MSAFAPHFVLNEMFAAAFNDALQKFAVNIVHKCADNYGFDREDALRFLDIHNISTSFDSNTKISNKNINKNTNKNTNKPAFPLPFSGTRDHSLCDALKLNKGLYTQCTESPIQGQNFCASCFQQVQANPNGLPNYGTIQQRCEQGLYDFKDPSGNSPVPYSKLMTKLNITKQQVIDEAAKFDFTIPDEHFDFLPNTKRGRPSTKTTDSIKSDNNDDTPKKKGRPRKAPIQVHTAHDPTDDLFANLVSLAQNNKPDNHNNDNKPDTQKDFDNTTHDNDNDFDNQAIALIEAIENNNSVTADNISSNIINYSSTPKHDKLAAKEQAKKDKEAAKEQAKKDKEAAKEQAKKEKEAAKEQAKKDKEAAKEAAKKEKELAKKATKKADPTPAPAPAENNKKPDNQNKPDNHDDDASDTVQRISFNGIKYLRSTKSHVVYNLDEEPIGIWNFTTNSIDLYDNDELEHENLSDDE